jgi:hypothetical protein
VDTKPAVDTKAATLLNKTQEVAHSPLCCVSGHVLEPPLPHMKNRI